MEQLNKQQIILLALLVSFVSSIATGITTVSLMDQTNQPTVTQTINRVVERTIEKVVPDEKSANAKTVLTETVIVREDQALVDAIGKASKGVVRIYSSTNGSSPRFIGIGIILSSLGKIAARIEGQATGGLTAVLDGGNIVSLSPLSYDASHDLHILQAEQSIDPLSARVYTAALLGNSNNLKLGQSIAFIGGKETARVASGIIAGLDTEDGSISGILTNMTDSSFDRQAVLVNLLGEVVGIGSLPSDIIKTYATP